LVEGGEVAGEAVDAEEEEEAIVGNMLLLAKFELI
jgi:hypothetical protein